MLAKDSKKLAKISKIRKSGQNGKEREMSSHA